MILTWYGDPNGNWYSLWALHKSPSTSKVACPHTLIRVHLQGVVVPAQKTQPSNRWFLFSQILYLFLVSSVVKFITTLQAQILTVFRIKQRELTSWCSGMWHHVVWWRQASVLWRHLLPAPSLSHVYETSCHHMPEHHSIQTHHRESFKAQTQSTKLTSPGSLKFLTAKEFIIQANPKDMHIERRRVLLHFHDCCTWQMYREPRSDHHTVSTNGLFDKPYDWHVLGQCSWYRDWLWAGKSRDRIPVGVRCSAPVETGSGVCWVSCTMGRGSFSQG